MGSFELIEHTADIGIRVFGKNKKDLFKSAACALFSLLVDHQPQPKQKKTISLEADSLDELLVVWLNELIFLFATQNFVPATYLFRIISKKGVKKLTVQIKGRQINSFTNKIKMEIKAATYHNLKVYKNKNGYVGEVIFDL